MLLIRLEYPDGQCLTLPARDEAEARYRVAMLAETTPCRVVFVDPLPLPEGPAAGVPHLGVRLAWGLPA
jgi:hypothetical protein